MSMSRSFAALSLLMVATACAGTRPVSRASAQPEAPVQFWALSVADAAVVADWYETHFGFETVTEMVAPSGRGLTRVLKNDFAILELVQAQGARKAAEIAPELERRVLIHGIFKVGFFVNNLDGIVDQLRKSGVVFRGSIVSDSNLNVRTILATDPEGNTVQLFQRITPRP